MLLAGCALWLTVGMFLWPVGSPHAHPGPLDRYGGHFDQKTTVYHYHKPRADMSRRKSEYRSWIEPNKTGEIQGRVMKIERAGAIWVEIPYRPAYQEFAQILPPVSRDDKAMRLLVWFRFVSPEASVHRGKKYDAWFRKKVIYELKRKLQEKVVNVQFQIVPNSRRLHGMVFLDKENINLWLVLNGWSYYLLDQGQNPFEKTFLQAENLAKRDRAGLWKQSQ